MKKEEIKTAYENLEFSEDLENRYFGNIVSKTTKKQYSMKRRMVPVLLCILLFGSILYTSAKFDWFNWKFGKNTTLIHEKIDKEVYSTQNKYLKMSVESAVFTQETGRVFVHIQALNENGKQFMKKYAESIIIGLEMGEETSYSASSSGAKYYKELSDDENWYYYMNFLCDRTSLNQDTISAKILLEKSVNIHPDTEKFKRMELEFPVKQIIDATQHYAECGKFQNIYISPLAIAFEWEIAETSNEQIDLSIKWKDGNVLKLQWNDIVSASASTVKTKSISETWEIVMLTTDAVEKQACLTLIPEKVLNTEEIDTITINGIVCK